MNSFPRRYFLFIISCFISPLMVTSQTLSLIDTGFSATSVNAVIFRKNSVVSHNNSQFAAFYDTKGFLTLAKRKLETNNWEVKKTSYQGNVADAHNSISIMVDGEDFLHVVLDEHNSPLHYFLGRNSGSLELSQAISMTGKDEKIISYPEFYRFSDGDLLFLYRSGESGNGNLVMNYYHLKTKTWERLHDVLIDGQGQRNAYWQVYIDINGSIHLSWVWRETPDVASNHDMCYAISNDRGNTWKKSTGEKYNLPITEKTAEIARLIPQNSELINQTSMYADTKGTPFIATYFKTDSSLVPQYQLIYLENGIWNTNQITARKTPFSLSGMGTKKIPVSRPQLVVSEGQYGIKVILIFRDEERGKLVSLAMCDSFPNGYWKYFDLTNFSVGDWEPSFDTELWKNLQKLHLFVQHVGQGDGEQLSDAKPQPVYILEVDPVLIK